MFQKPTVKTATNPAVMAAGFVVGAKVGDGLATLVPEAAQPYRRWILGVLGIGLAACVKTTTTSGVAAQSALIGMGAKQVYDEVSEMLTEKVDAQDSTTTSGKFLNAVIGHKEIGPAEALGYIQEWQPNDEAAMEVDWTREPANQVAEITGV